MTYDIRETDHGPLIITVPGLDNSGPQHWQTLWEQQRDDMVRAELGMWSNPHRNTWVNQLNRTIAQVRRPVVLVGHSLGCATIAWWAAMEQPAHGTVIGALLVAPPDLDRETLDPRIAGFGPLPPQRLPFRAIVAGSRNDPYISLDAARTQARRWGAQFADAGAIGHINAQSGIGDWDFGRFLLDYLIATSDYPQAEPFDGAGVAPSSQPRQTTPAHQPTSMGLHP